VFVELLIILETLENVVSWVETFHATVNDALEVRVACVFDSTVVSKLLMQVLKPQVNYLSVLVANIAKGFTGTCHVLRTEEGKLVGKTPFDILSNLFHSPGLVHLCDSVVTVYHRLITLSLQNTIKVLKEGGEHVIVEAVDRQFGVVGEALLDGCLEEQVGTTHPLSGSIKLAAGRFSIRIQLVHLVNEYLVALFAFKFVKISALCDGLGESASSFRLLENLFV
jgi:hypothetical protein